MRATATLSIAGLTKWFGGLEALHSVDFCVNPGEIVGVIGPNGSGKTTLFDIVTGFIAGTSGSVRYGERELHGLSPSAICKLGLSRTFQLVRSFRSVTVMENIMIGYLGKGESVADAHRSALEIAKLTGLTEVLKYEAQYLSSGMKKRLECARALATDPEVLLLDEVMAGLSPKECEEMIDLVRPINQRGTTVIMVEHIMDVIVAFCPRVVVLSSGRKIADGDTETVLNNPDVVNVYLGGD